MVVVSISNMLDIHYYAVLLVLREQIKVCSDSPNYRREALFRLNAVNL